VVVMGRLVGHGSAPSSTAGTALPYISSHGCARGFAASTRLEATAPG
jgi:hypothetical protein